MPIRDIKVIGNSFLESPCGGGCGETLLFEILDWIHYCVRPGSDEVDLYCAKCWCEKKWDRDELK